jgi:hypothetical protein
VVFVSFVVIFYWYDQTRSYGIKPQRAQRSQRRAKDFINFARKPETCGVPKESINVLCAFVVGLGERSPQRHRGTEREFYLPEPISLSFCLSEFSVSPCLCGEFTGAGIYSNSAKLSGAIENYKIIFVRSLCPLWLYG